MATRRADFLPFRMATGVASWIGRPAQLDLLKDLNRASVLAIIRQAQNLSRAELSRRSGLSKATASLLVEEFVQAGLLVEVGSGQSNGGRPPLLLEFRPEARLALGAEFAHDEVIAVVTDLNGHVLQETRRPVTDRSPESVLAATGDLAEQLLNVVGRAPVLGLGFASPGLVDVEQGIVKQAIDVGWRDVPASQLLGNRLGMPVAIANRSKTAALAESWSGTQPASGDLVYVFIGSGIAAGIVHDGTLYLGATSSAGELGHVTVDPNGPVCDCGNAGCLHVYASEAAIARRARELARDVPASSLVVGMDGDLGRVTADSVIDAALAGDRLAGQVIREMGTFVGVAVANVVNLFNPDIVVVGGPTSRAGSLLLDAIETEVRRRGLPIPTRHVQIRQSALGDAAGAIGGAFLILRHASQLIFRGEGSID